MIFATYGSGIGADLIAAEHFGYDIKFAHTPYPDTKKVLEAHFPNVPIYISNIPQTNVEVLSTRSPGPPRHIHGLTPQLDRNYLDLALQCFKLAKKLSARWVVWESTPNFVSSQGGEDLSAIWRTLEELGYGFAYRVLDSKYFGIPQSRRSIFIVGYYGDWRPPAAVLFDQITASEYRSQDRKKRHHARIPQDLADWRTFALPFKLAHQTHLYWKAPRLPYLKETEAYHYQHLPFVFISEEGARFPTEIEAERLQGFKDDYTKIFSSKVKPFGYKVRLGLISDTSTVPVYIWLLNRLAQVDKIKESLGEKEIAYSQ